MTGSERRRNKRQREMAAQAVRDLPRFVKETNDSVLRLHQHARVRASNLQTREEKPRPMPLSADVQHRAAGLDADLAAVERLLTAVFVERTATPESIGLDPVEAGSLRQAGRRALLVVRQQLRKPSIESEVADSASSALAVSVAPALHRLVWGCYSKGSRPDRSRADA